MLNMKWWILQLFAGEGAGGSGAAAGGDGAAAATGENTADAGQQRLRELGVPENRIRKNRAYRVPGQTEQKAADSSEPAEPQQAAAAEADPPAEGAQNQNSPRMTWDEIAKDPEYQKNIQTMMQQRVQKSKASEEAMAKLTPALELLAQLHGQDPGKIDYDALAKSIMDDGRLYQKKAMELDVPDEVAKTLVQQEMQINRQKRLEDSFRQHQQANQHFTALEEQAKGLKDKYPGFDLRTELRNPAFEQMVRPGSQISVEQAYYAVHQQEIQQAQAQVIANRTAEQLSNSIQANARRPAESGAAQAPSATTFDYKNASPAERAALKKRIRAAGARGEKIYPGR